MSDITAEILWFVLIVVVFPLLIGALISLFVAFFLGAMQIQEQTTTFLLRLLVIIAVVFLSWSWIEQRLLLIFHDCFVMIAA